MSDPAQLESTPWYHRLWLAIWHFLIGRHGFDLDKSARNRFGVLILAVAAVTAWATIKILSAWAQIQATADEPAWELALQARLLLFRAKVALGLALFVLGLTQLEFMVLDRTRLGKRLMHWSQAADSESTAAAKTATAGRVYMALLIMNALLAAQVLR